MSHNFGPGIESVFDEYWLVFMLLTFKYEFFLRLLNISFSSVGTILLWYIAKLVYDQYVSYFQILKLYWSLGWLLSVSLSVEYFECYDEIYEIRRRWNNRYERDEIEGANRSDFPWKLYMYIYIYIYTYR